MQKTILTKAVAVALATLGASAAMAQSSVTIYGVADVSIDHVSKSQGGAIASQKANITRVSPSGTSQTSYGLKGTEDLGDGYKAGFVLEGQLNYDTGALSQDGRIFGRQSFASLTTPFGEVRLGRQYAPIFYSTAFITTERFGATDLFIEGGSSNNLMVRQDNQLSYWLKLGGFTGELAYTPNAGVAPIVSAARSTTPATSGTGQILGGATAGGEDSTSRGRSYGLFLSYMGSGLTLTGGYHHNDFDGALAAAPSAPLQAALGVSMPALVVLDKFDAGNLGVKYTLPGNGITFSGVYGFGKYGITSGSSDIKLDFFALGASIPVGNWTLVAQGSQVKFRSQFIGKDTGLLLGADYNLSKRTALYGRVGQIKDKNGGPDVVGPLYGFREVPVYAGAGINIDGRTSYVGFGIRHTF